MVSRGRALSIAVAIALVTVPLWGPAAALSSPQFEYRAVELMTTNGTLDVDTDRRVVVHGDLHIDCLGTPTVVRGCVHDASLLNGTRVVDYPNLQSGSGNPTLARHQYVAFGFGSPIYRRTADYAGGGSYRLGLERVPVRAALRDVASDPEYVPATARRAIETGTVSTSDQLPQPYIVAAPDDGAEDPTFYLVYRAARNEPFSVNPGDAAVFEALAVLMGAWWLLGMRPPLSGD